MKTYSKLILKMLEKDIELRQKLIQEGVLNDSYHEKMRKLHNENSLKLEKTINAIGFKNIEKFDENVRNAFFIIVQHSIDNPKFMKFCFSNFKKHTIINKIQLAQLSDRIRLFQDKPQKYGTQFDWDENGVLNPSPIDDLEKVNSRRKKIGLNSLEEQTQLMRKNIKQNNEKPPKNFLQKKIEYTIWRKEVGWI